LITFVAACFFVTFQKKILCGFYMLVRLKNLTAAAVVVVIVEFVYYYYYFGNLMTF